MIYFVRMGKTNFIKIGYTSKADCSDRISQLQTACPLALELIHVREGELSDEAMLHARCIAYKTGGGDEWFQLPEEVITQLIGDQHGRENNQRGIEGPTAFDVRPLRGRQLNPTADSRESLSGRPGAFDHPQRKLVFLTLRGE